MPDIRIEYPAKPAAYVEVVVDIESSYAAMDAEISKGLRTLPSDRIWWVRLSGRSNVKELRRKLPTLLGRLADATDQGAAQQLTKMGVTVDGPGIPRPGQTGGIHLLPAGIEGSATPAWPSLVEWLAGFSHQAKRPTSGASSRLPTRRSGMLSLAPRSQRTEMRSSRYMRRDARNCPPAIRPCHPRLPNCGFGRPLVSGGAWHGFRTRVGSMSSITGPPPNLLLAERR